MQKSEDNLKFIRKMEHFQDIYKSFRDIIAPQLQSTAIVNGDTFTSHGYDHCKRIFKEIDNLFYNNQQFYEDIAPEEIFCLALAVLLHDLVMTRKPELRHNHSEEAKKIIRQEFEKAKKSFLTWKPEDSIVDSISEIVYAHSDIKNDSNLISIKTLESVKDATHRGSEGPIRVNILAAILRFGDELDCTNERINDCQRIIKNNETDENFHFRKCELIREIMPIDTAGTNIVISINKLILQESDDLINDVEKIKIVVEKLKSSLKEVNETIFHPQKINWWHFNSVCLTKESDEYLDQIGDQIKETDPLGKPQIDKIKEKERIHFEKESDGIIRPDQTINDYIVTWVKKENLLLSGHFEITGNKHARDWIDTSRLLGNNYYLGSIVKSFIEILKQNHLDASNTLLIGYDFPGLLIASQMGFIGGFGCTYITSSEEKSINDSKDIFSLVSDIKYFVLVTDVIVEGETILESLGKLYDKAMIKPDRVKLLLSVLQRKPLNSDRSLKKEIKEKLIALNTSFPIQLCDKNPKDCIFANSKSVDVINESLNKLYVKGETV